MSNLEKIIYDLRSYNFTQRKIQSNLLIAQYLEDIVEIGFEWSLFKGYSKGKAVLLRTKQLFNDLQELK